MAEFIRFFNNFSINIVAPFTDGSTSIKLDAAHPRYVDLQTIANDFLVSSPDYEKLAPLTVTDGTDVEVIRIDEYDAVNDVFLLGTRFSAIDWSVKTGVIVEMRVTADALEDIQARLLNLENAVFPPGSGGGA